MNIHINIHTKIRIERREGIGKSKTEVIRSAYNFQINLDNKYDFISSNSNKSLSWIY